MTIEADIRTPLQTALTSIAANVYNGIPETMTSPSIVLVPDSPYLESTLSMAQLQKSNQFSVTGVVGYSNNAAALDNLEHLMISIISAQCPAVMLSAMSAQPQPLEVGAGKYLDGRFTSQQRTTPTKEKKDHANNNHHRQRHHVHH
jgi:hypothetical protein